MRQNSEQDWFFRWWGNYSSSNIEQAFVPQNKALTHYWHFRNTSSVNFFLKCWFIVIDVMDFDDKLWFRFHWSQGSSINSLGTQGVKGFLFPVNSPSSMNVTCFLINYKKSTSPISWQNVFEGSISLVLVRMKLKKKKNKSSNSEILKDLALFLFDGACFIYLYCYILNHSECNSIFNTNKKKSNWLAVMVSYWGICFLT